MRAAWIAAAALLTAGCMQELDTGPGDYTLFCASCHGASGKGDGWAAASLNRRPADLTTLAARQGGFDLVGVMSRIDGYGRDDEGQVMPDFGPILEGETVLVDTGNGVLTPTPRRLYDLALYLERLQE